MTLFQALFGSKTPELNVSETNLEEPKEVLTVQEEPTSEEPTSEETMELEEQMLSKAEQSKMGIRNKVALYTRMGFKPRQIADYLNIPVKDVYTHKQYMHNRFPKRIVGNLSYADMSMGERRMFTKMNSSVGVINTNTKQKETVYEVVAVEEYFGTFDVYRVNGKLELRTRK